MEGIQDMNMVTYQSWISKVNDKYCNKSLISIWIKHEHKNNNIPATANKVRLRGLFINNANKIEVKISKISISHLDR